MRTNLSRYMLAGLGLALASQAQAAGSVTGSIAATLTLTAACQVNGSTATSAANFGALNFGTQDSLFTTASAQVLSGGNALSILCSTGVTPVIKVRAGLHDGLSSGGTRALGDGSGNYVPYDFYTDSGHSTLLPIDGTITLPTSTGAAQGVNLYGQARGKAGLPAGSYADTVSVELTF
jgi:spore coat protein U-like protein